MRDSPNTERPCALRVARDGSLHDCAPTPSVSHYRLPASVQIAGDSLVKDRVVEREAKSTPIAQGLNNPLDRTECGSLIKIDNVEFGALRLSDSPHNCLCFGRFESDRGNAIRNEGSKIGGAGANLWREGGILPSLQGLSHFQVRFGHTGGKSRVRTLRAYGHDRTTAVEALHDPAELRPISDRFRERIHQRVKLRDGTRELGERNLAIKC